jgi:hypothetical protein
VTQTQALIGSMDGQPSYDDTKARMLKVANGDAPPVGTRSGLPVPNSHLGNMVGKGAASSRMIMSCVMH